MNWNSWAEFWDMGGYAFFVWGSYGAVAVGMALELWLARHQRKAVLSALRLVREEAALTGELP